MKIPEKINWTKIEAYTNDPWYKMQMKIIEQLEQLTKKKPE